MISALVLGHGNIAQALVDASQRIVGDTDHIFTLQTPNYSAKQLYEEVANFVRSNKFADGLFIFVCIKGGSYWNAAIRAAKEFDNIKVISGVNLPLILSFLTKRKTYSFIELEKILMEDIVRGICIV